MATTTYTWIDGTSGDWGTAADWSPTGVPDAMSDASFVGSGAETVTVSSDEAVDQITLDNAGTTLTVQGNATLSVYGGLLATAGTISIVGGGGQATVDVLAPAGFGSPSVLTGNIALGDYAQPTSNALLEFSSGQIADIAQYGSLILYGPNALVADAGSLSSNSALQGLSTIEGTFELLGGTLQTTGDLNNSGIFWADVDYFNNGSSGTVTIGGTVTNSYAFSISDGTTVTASGFNNTGNLQVASSFGEQAKLDIAGPAGFGTAGVLTGNVQIEGNAAIEFASGQITDIASGAGLSIGGPNAFVEDASSPASNSALQGLSTIEGSFQLVGGTVQATGDLANSGFVQVDDFDQATASLSISGTLTNSGDITIGGQFGPGGTVSAAGLDNQSTGDIRLGGYPGQLAALNISGAVENDGTLTAGYASVDLQGPVSGNGSTVINYGAIVEFGSSVASTERVIFNNSGSFDYTLKIDQPGQFSGIISGFGSSPSGIDIIELANVQATSATTVSFSNGVTTLHVDDAASNVIANLRLLGDYTGYAFNVSGDTITTNGAAPPPPADDTPALTVPGAQTVTVGNALELFGSGHAVSVSDPDADILGETFTVQISHSANNGAGFTILPEGATVTGSGTDNVTVAGTLAQVNAALGTLDYASNNLGVQPGTDTITFQVTDSDGGTDTKTVAVNLSPATGVALTTLASFNGSDGANPYASLVRDANGNLFGTTLNGGANGYGTVFELVNNGTPAAPSYADTPVTLASFDNADGANPVSSLIADANGDLFGTTIQGGAYGGGTVFELVNDGTATSPNYAATPTPLVDFNYSNGADPSFGGLIADANGDLFGTTYLGGANGYGTVFELVNDGTAASPSYAATPTPLTSFDPVSDGAYPSGNLFADANGDLFGTTTQGGAYGGGTVFEIVNNGTADVPSYAPTPATLVSFNGTNGLGVVGGVIADANGDLFGTTVSGGANGYGTVFELVNDGTAASPSYASAPTTLVDFNYSNGANPETGLIADANGDLFGTTLSGGANGLGTVFELVNVGTATAPSYAAAPTTLVSFDYSNGANPYGNLIADGIGNLFGTTVGGGANDTGTVFEISGAFVVPADDDTGEQAALVLAVNGSSATPIGSAGAGTVAFTVAGLDPEDTGTVTFTDAENKTVVVDVKGGQTDYTADLSTLAGGTITSSLAVATDPAGNSFTPVAGNSVSFDQTAPQVTVSLDHSLVNLAAETALVTFAFSEAVAGFGLGSVTASGGSLSNLQTSDGGKTCTATFTATSGIDIANANVSVNAGGYQDLAGNAGSAAGTGSFIVDTVSPTVSVTTSNSDVNVANGTATITFSFSEAPTDFSLAHVSATGGTLGSLRQVNATTYTAVFTGLVGTDISTAKLSVDSTWHENNGNAGTGGATSSFVVDTVTPSVAVSINNSHLTLSARTATVTFSFSEAPVSFALADTTAVGGALSSLVKVNDTTYTATFTAAANTQIGNATVSVVASSWQEGNGNPGSGGATANFSVDTYDHWIASGGSWGTASNWGNGVPSAGVAADIDRTGTYTATISGTSSAYGLLVNDAGATVSDGKNGALTLAGTGGSNGALTISAGTFALAGGSLAAGSISIASGGVLQISQSYAALAEAIPNNGAITLTSAAAKGISATFTGTLTGTGTVSVQGGATAIFAAAVSGSGSFSLAGNGSLEFARADSENVTFAAGATGTLKLDHSLTAPFTGKISGLTPSDAVDLADLKFSKKGMTASYAGNTTGGVLTVSNGSQSVSLNLLGDYTHSAWTLSKDASGGTLVVDPVANQAAALVASTAFDLLDHAMWAHSALGSAGHSDVLETLTGAAAPYGQDLALLMNHMASDFPLEGAGNGYPSQAAINQQMLLGVSQHA